MSEKEEEEKKIKKTLEKAFRSRAKGVWCCSHVAPESCPSVAPIFDVGSSGKNSHTKDKKKPNIYHQKEPVIAVQAFAPPTLLPELS